jgi:hypothetical protein
MQAQNSCRKTLYSRHIFITEILLRFVPKLLDLRVLKLTSFENSMSLPQIDEQRYLSQLQARGCTALLFCGDIFSSSKHVHGLLLGVAGRMK